MTPYGRERCVLILRSLNDVQFGFFVTGYAKCAADIIESKEYILGRTPAISDIIDHLATAQIVMEGLRHTTPHPFTVRHLQIAAKELRALQEKAFG